MNTYTVKRRSLLREKSHHFKYADANLDKPWMDSVHLVNGAG